MEVSALADENNGGTDILASNSKGSTIKIDSIFIDLNNTKEKTESKNCDHFSIRGYVDEIRKRDWKFCWPFDLDDNAADEACLLPPLHVAKFKWWHCKNCLREIGAKGDPKENRVVPNCFNTESKSNGTCSLILAHGGEGSLISDSRQALKLDVSEGRRAAAISSFPEHSNESLLPSHREITENKISVEKASIIGHENAVLDVVNKEIPRTTCGATEVNPCLQQERGTDGAGIKLQCNGFVGFRKPDYGTHRVVDTGFAVTNMKCMVNGYAKNCHTEKHICVDGQQTKLMAACGSSNVVHVVDEAFNVVRDHATENPSMDIDDCAELSETESDDILAANNLNHDNSSALHGKRTRKVRLLTELLGANKNAYNDHSRVEDVPDKALFDAQGSLVPQKNVIRGVRHQIGKRKMLQDEDWRPQEMCSSNISKKKVRFLKADAERADINNTIAISELDDSAPVRMCLQNGLKSHNSKPRINRNPVLNKKKFKKAHFSDNCLSLIPSADVGPEYNHHKIRDADKGSDAFFKSVPDMLKGRDLNHSFESYLPAEFTKRKTSLSKKEKKMPQVEDGLASPIAWNSGGRFSEDPITRKEANIVQMVPETVSFQTVKNASHRHEELHLSLQGYLAAQKNDRNYTSQVENGLDHLLFQQQGFSREHQIVRTNINNRYVGECSAPFTSAPDAFFGRQQYSDLSIEKPTSRTPFLGGKQNCTPLVECDAFPVMRQKDFPVMCNNEKIGAQKLSEATKSDRRAQKTLEQGAVDDIPMEIVELMAKNQYERCLHDAKNNYCQLESTNNVRNAKAMNFTEVQGNGALRFLTGESSQLRKIQSSNARNGIINADETMQPFKQKSVNFFSLNRNHFNMGQLEETRASAGFTPLSECQEKLSSGAQFSASTSSGHCSAQNCQFTGDTMDHRFSHASLQSSEAYNRCHTVSLKRDEAPRVWSSMMSNDMSFGLNIPRKCGAQSSNTNMLSQFPVASHKANINGNHDLNILNLNVGRPEKPTRNFSSETSNRVHIEYPFACRHKGNELHPKLMGSLDLYSNETIPAMHLLSLMDAGLRSDTNFNMDGNQKMLKKPSFSSDHPSKELPGLGYGVCKTGDSSRYPSSQFYSKNNLSEKSCECCPGVPPFCSLSSFQNNRNFEVATGFTAQVSSRSGRDEKMKSLYSPVLKKGRKPKKSIGTNQSVPVHGMKSILGPSDSVMYPLQYHAVDVFHKHIEMPAHSNGRNVWPVKGFSEVKQCSVNRNPADFSIPGAGNVYMIGAEDLKFGKTVPSANRSGLFKLNKLKRHGILKHSALKEHTGHRSS